MPSLKGFVPERILNKLPSKVANKLNVHAFSQDNFTVVVLTEGEKMVVGVAKLNPTDKRSLDVGVAIAGSRAVRHYIQLYGGGVK